MAALPAAAMQPTERFFLGVERSATGRAWHDRLDELTDMEAACARLAQAVIHGESVAIFGDYDVDGATASALLTRYLRHCGLDPIVHIPDRIFEGYGPNVDAIRAFAERDVKLLVTVDCGTNSLEPLTEAKKLGLETVVIDHHQAEE